MQRASLVALLAVLGASATAYAQLPYTVGMYAPHYEEAASESSRDRKLLPSFDLGQGEGSTASELGVTDIFYETYSIRLFDAMAGSADHKFRVYLTNHRKGAYFAKGSPFEPNTYGPRKSGYVIPAKLHPDAREGSDFTLTTDEKGNAYVLVLNSAALVTDPFYFQDPDRKDAIAFFKKVFSTEKIAFNDRGKYQLWRVRMARFWRRDASEFISASTAAILARLSVADMAAKWVFLPEEATDVLVIKADRRVEARKLLETYKKDPTLARCEESVLVADFLLLDYPSAKDYLSVLGLPEGHLCAPFFAALWIEKAERFIRVAQPTITEIEQARRQSGDFVASITLMREAEKAQRDGTLEAWTQEQFESVLQPIWSTSYDHPYRKAVRHAWTAKFESLFLRNGFARDDRSRASSEDVIGAIQDSTLPHDELFEIFVSYVPEKPHFPDEVAPDTWQIRAILVAEHIAYNLGGDEQLLAAEGLFRALKKQKREEWIPKTIHGLRIHFQKSEYLTTRLIDELLPLIDVKSERHLLALINPSLVPEGAGPTWELQIRGFIRKARNLGEGPCNAALQ